MKSVAVLYKSLPAYRLEFFDQLRDTLLVDGVTLDLIHGDAVGADTSKSDARTLPWATHASNRVASVRGRPLVWQPALAAAMRHDLVVVEQASKLLINYPLLAISRSPWGPRLAFWGHGANLQTHTASRLSEALKRKYSRLPYWWFAYTEGSKSRVAELGFAPDRITVVQNSIDTAGLQSQISDVQEHELEGMRERLRLVRGRVGLFLGSLYPEKRLDFLVQSATAARRADPLFSLLIGGDGPARGDVEEAISGIPFIHYLGRLDGAERARTLAVSDVMLMPGLVGLGILDAFAAGLPLMTTGIDYHSPEIEYLTHGRNGLILPHNASPDEFGQSIAELMADRKRMTSLTAASRRDASRYTTEAMVTRFRDGVLRAIA